VWRGRFFAQAYHIGLTAFVIAWSIGNSCASSTTVTPAEAGVQIRRA
jgi:hypothetical protein